MATEFLISGVHGKPLLMKKLQKSPYVVVDGDDMIIWWVEQK